MLIGRNTRDVELKFLPNGGTAVATFSLAVDKDLAKDKKAEFESEGKPTADFINIVVWGKSAEYVANYLKKGKLVGIQGRIQTRSWDDPNGNSKRYTTEVVANQVQILEWENKDTNTSYNSYAPEGFHPTDNDDIPF